MLTSTGSAARARGDISPNAITPIAPANHRNMLPPTILVPSLETRWAIGFKQDRIMLGLASPHFVVDRGVRDHHRESAVEETNDDLQEHTIVRFCRAGMAGSVHAFSRVACQCR